MLYIAGVLTSSGHSCNDFLDHLLPKNFTFYFSDFYLDSLHSHVSSEKIKITDSFYGSSLASRLQIKICFKFLTLFRHFFRVKNQDLNRGLKSKCLFKKSFLVWTSSMVVSFFEYWAMSKKSLKISTHFCGLLRMFSRKLICQSLSSSLANAKKFRKSDLAH